MNNQNELQSIRQYQIVKRQDGFFQRSTEIIFSENKKKTIEQIQQEQSESIKKNNPWGGIFQSIKVANIYHSGNGSINITL